VGEAERRADVAWLDENGTPDAVAALGRLADARKDAIAVLEARSSFDVQAFRAAWFAALRSAPWGSTLLEEGLGDPKRAELAAAGMGRQDLHLGPFLGALEAALVRLSATPRNLQVASVLASAGPMAHEATERRLTDASTRGAMCRGIASRDAAPDAHKVLLGVNEAARDSPACVDAAVRIAADDDAALAWLGEAAEPGLLGAAGKADVLPCPRLHVAWTRALATRKKDAYPALGVPLGYAVKRCPAEMDGVLADAIARLPQTRAVVLDAIDPFDRYDGALHATCAALPLVAAGRDTAITKERASDALAHGCRAPG
jgi:hypothetical protein